MAGHREDAEGLERERDPMFDNCDHHAKLAADLRIDRMRRSVASAPHCDPPRFNARPKCAIEEVGAEVRNRRQNAPRAAPAAYAPGVVRNPPSLQVIGHPSSTEWGGPIWTVDGLHVEGSSPPMLASSSVSSPKSNTSMF
jgi:hypothetical protein